MQQLRAWGECVVVIERDEKNDELSRCRQMGAIVLIGAANDRWLLDKACVHRAKALISIIGDDGTNVETAVLAHELNKKRTSGSLDCVVHLFDPRLQRVLKTHRIYTDQDDPFVLRFFNAFEIGAHAMLHNQPAVPSGSPEKAGPPHLLVVGMGRLGEALLVQAATDWRAERKGTSDQFYVTLIDRHAMAKKEWLTLRYPDLNDACRCVFLEMDVHFPGFPSGIGLEGGNGIPPVSAVYVCVDSDSLALFTALALHECLKGKGVPIVVRMTEEAGLAALLGSDDSGGGLIEGVHAVGLLDVTCSLDLVLGKAS